MPRAKSLNGAISQFHQSIDKTGDCWIWTGAREPTGYGYIYWPGRRSSRKAHRVSWELFRGPIPAGLCVCHHCDNPPCVNPDHLFVGTHGDNCRDRNAKGRAAPKHGRHNGRAILTEDDVREIRRPENRRTPARILAGRYGVSRSLICMVRRRECWTHI